MEITMDYTSIRDLEILNVAYRNGIISDNDLLELRMKKDRENSLQKHKFKIWKGKGGDWYTYLPDDRKGRRLVKRRSREDLEEELIRLYLQEEEVFTIHKVFVDWLAEKMEYKEICKGTFDRYEQDYNRFIKGTSMEKKKFRNISEDDLDEFVRRTIARYSLTAKGYAGVRTLLMGIFKYGKRKRLTDISISHFFGDFYISRNVFRKRVIEKEKEVFMEEEIPIVKEYLRQHPTPLNLGILLLFYTGLRCGELCTLKKEDLKGKTIHIRRTEIRYKDSQTNKQVHVVKEFPKSLAGDRYVVIPNEAVAILEQIVNMNPNGEYLFERNGRWIYGESFTQGVATACRECGLPTRSAHKIRKTYGTTLLDANVDESIIIEQMGHADINCTKQFYYFSNKKEETKRIQIERALCD